MREMGGKFQRQLAEGQYLDKFPVVVWLLVAIWILVIGGVAFLLELGNTGLVDETEPLFAEAARQMHLTGDWITPYFNGETRFDKPPLIYWLMAICYQIFGVNEWAVRLPSALSAIALMAMGFYILRRFGTTPSNPSPSPWLPALIGSALIALHPSTIIWARTGVSDMLLTSCMGLAMMSFFCGYAHPLPTIRFLRFSPWYLSFYVFIALAILTKGPVGLVLPGLIIAAFLLYVGKFREVLGEMRWWWGLIIILAIALPWYVLVTLANGEAYIDSFFGYHNLERFTSVVNRHRAPWYFYFGVVAAGFAPWSIYLPLAIARLQFWKRSIWRNQNRSTHLGLFAWFWFAGVFVFFTVAVTKLPSYVLPLMPAAAILVAMFWGNQLAQPRSGWGWKVTILGNAVLFLAMAALLIHSPRFFQNDEVMPNLSPLLQQSGLPLLGGAIAAATAGFILLLTLSRRSGWIWIANVLGMLAIIIFVLMPAATIVDSQRQLPLRQLSQVVVQQRQPDEELFMIGFKKPSLVFYTRHNVIFNQRITGAIPELKEAAQKPTPPHLLILLPQKILARLPLPPDQYSSLGQAGTYQLIRVSKEAINRLPAPP